jgi:hypothetical protein
MIDDLEKICFFVFKDDCCWIAEFEHQDIRHMFPSFESARDAARQAAEARWLMTGKTTCVRIGDPSGPTDLDEMYA